MSKNTGRTVYLRSDGRWANKPNDALRASGIHPRQAEAEAEARQMLVVAGGGELTIKNDEGVILSREFVAPANHDGSAHPDRAAPLFPFRSHQEADDEFSPESHSG